MRRVRSVQCDHRVDSSFCECDVRGVDLGIRADNTYFMQCKGPVKTIQFFDQRIGSSWGDGFGVGKDKDLTSRGLNDLKSWNIRELTSGISYRDNGDSQKLREKLDRQQYSNTPPDPLLVCTHVIKMEKLLCDMDQNELYSRDRSPWHNLDGLVSWVESTDTRFPKTVAEFGSNRVLLTEYASRPANRDSFVVDRDKDGRVCGISRKDDAELVIGDGLFGGRGRGSLSIA